MQLRWLPRGVLFSAETIFAVELITYRSNVCSHRSSLSAWHRIGIHRALGRYPDVFRPP